VAPGDTRNDFAGNQSQQLVVRPISEMLHLRNIEI